MTRREFLFRLAGVATLPSWAQRIKVLAGETYHELPPLPYAYDALEPRFDARTMELHHQKHHGGYVNNLNAALENLPAFQKMPLEELLRNLNQVPETYRTLVRNNAGGHWNHSFWWPMLSPQTIPPSEGVKKILSQAFGSFEAFKGQFLDAAVKLFGSGWVWLIRTSQGKLQIISTPNQDNPLMAPIEGKPILGVDVWEHAYYLKYQNRRIEYLVAFWELIHWGRVEQKLFE